MGNDQIHIKIAITNKIYNYILFPIFDVDFF